MNRIPWKVLLLILAVVLLFANNSANAYDRVGSASGGIKNTTSVTKTKCHVRIHSDTNIKKIYTGSTYLIDPNGNIKNPTSISGVDTWTVDVWWTGLNIPPNKNIGWFVGWKLKEKNWCDATGELLSSPDSLPMPVLGFSVDSCGAFALTNNYPQTINYTGLKYVVSDSLLPYSAGDSLAMLVKSISEGTENLFIEWASLPDGSVPPNSQSPTLVQLSISEGQFLAAYFAADFNDGTNPCYMIVQHEHQASSESIPTLTEWGLIVLVLVLLALGTWVFFWRRKAVAVRF